MDRVEKNSNQFTIDNTKCDQCELCLAACHTNCISLTGTGIAIDQNLCSTCTHCIAVCPQQALSWNNVLPEKIDANLLPTNQQLKEFLKARRSDFHYQDTKVDRELLRDIATMGKYSPTNNYTMDVVIVDDPDLIRELEKICLRGVKRIYNYLFKPKLIRSLINKLSPEIDQVAVKMEAGMREQRIFHDAPVLIFVIADPRIRLTLESAQYFMYNMQLYALTLGIGSRISGGGKRFLGKSKSARALLELPADRQIQGILTMGYPKHHYPNKVEGIAPRIYFK